MATSMEDRLDETVIANIVEKLTWQEMNIVAVEYMGFEMEKLNEMQIEYSSSVAGYKRAVTTRWQSEDERNTKQKLGDILYDSQLVSPHDIKEILKVDRSKDKLENCETKSKNGLSAQKLGRLADEIACNDLETIALKSFGVRFAKMKNRKSTSHDSWWFNFSTLVTYAKKPGSTAGTLKKILLDSKLVNPYDVKDILGEVSTADETFHEESKPETQGTETTSPARKEESQQKEATAPAPETKIGASELDGREQSGETTTGRQPDQKASWPFAAMSDLQKIYLAVAALGILILMIVVTPGVVNSILVILCVLAAGAYINFQREDPHITGSSKFLLPAESMFPKGRVCKRLHNYYEWLKFDEIRKCTNRWKDSTKPVVVAVLDTGIHEDHKDLNGKILTDQSKSFLPDSDEDLRQDKHGHGTMVAGIITRCGPENVKIINLKVMDSDGNGRANTLVEALEHVRSLKLTDPDGRDYGVDIINMSLGQFERSKDLDRVLHLLAMDKIIVAAVGNEGAQMSNAVNHPAKHPNVIGVGAHNKDGHISSLSSRGGEVKFLCPGEVVASTRTQYKEGVFLRMWNYILGLFGQQDLYFVANGTSLSSPYAAAVAAHVLVAREEEKGDRQEFCSSTVMLSVLQKLSDEPGDHPGVLRAYQNGFRNTDVLHDHCDEALKGH